MFIVVHVVEQWEREDLGQMSIWFDMKQQAKRAFIGPL